MLPSIDLFLRAFEDADRLMAGALGLELDYRRALKEMGESSFFFHISLSLRWPRQILLGSWPDPADLRSWMDLARNDLFRLAGTPVDINGIAGRWDNWARAEGLADSLVYTAPPAEKLSPVLVDLGRAVDTLGGVNSVELD